MKKLGNILFCFLPFLGSLFLQILICIPVSLYLIAQLFFSYPKVLSDPTILVQLLTQTLGSSSFSTLISASYGIISLILFSLWYTKCYATYDRKILSALRRPQLLASLVILAIGLQYVTGIFIGLIGSIFPSWVAHYEALMEQVGFTHMTALLFVYTVFIAPVSEELIFRGVTLHHATRHLPFWIANILQAILFGTLHMNLIQGLYAFFIGLFLGYVCWYGKSLSLSILLHMIFNFIGSYLPDLSLVFGPSLAGSLSILVVSVLLLICGFALFTRYVRR